MIFALLLLAHSWYPQNCCSDYDCEPLPVEAIVETHDGWHIGYCSPMRGVCVDNFVKRGQEKHSEDGRFHLCFTSERIICFFVPVVV